MLKGAADMKFSIEHFGKTSEDEDVMETSVIMQISNPVTYCMIGRLMGGDGELTW